jgi:hypothetical protein
MTTNNTTTLFPSSSSSSTLFMTTNNNNATLLLNKPSTTTQSLSTLCGDITNRLLQKLNPLFTGDYFIECSTTEPTNNNQPPTIIVDVYDYVLLLEVLKHKFFILNQSEELSKSKFAESWYHTTKDLLDDFAQIINEWDSKGNLITWLGDARMREMIDLRYARLSAHATVLDGILDVKTHHSNSGTTTTTTNMQQILHEIENDRDIFKHIPDIDVEGREFWETYIGKHNYTVDWNTFLTKLIQTRKSTLSPRSSASKTVLRDEQSIIQLKSSLDPSDTNVVTAHKFGLFLCTFGPGIDQSLARMEETLAEDWFAGFITFDEAQEVLKCSQVGSFLVRFSATHTCGFAIAYKTANDGIKQVLVTAKPGGFYLDEIRYTSLREIVQSRRRELKFPVKSISRQRFFKGFLTYEEAQDRLKSKPPGTFLIRFSQNTPGAFVIAWKDEERVQQSIITPDNGSNGGGFILNSTLYKSLDDLVNDNSDRLKYPLDEGMENQTSSSTTTTSRNNTSNGTVSIFTVVQDTSLQQQQQQQPAEAIASASNPIWEFDRYGASRSKLYGVMHS